MRILVTGGRGLVGSALREVATEDKLPGEWHFVSSSDADLLDREATEKMFARYKPTHVIHLAAKVGGLFANMQGKVDFFRDNVFMNDNVMECCRIHKVEKLISLMSSCVFPTNLPFPMDESVIHNGIAHHSNLGYAMAKRMLDVAGRCYRDQYGLNFITVIPVNVYGPHDNYSIEDGHVIPGLIHKCYLAKEQNTDFTLWGTGKPLRQFIYSKDLAKLMVWALREYDDPEPIVFSPAEETSIGEVAEIIQKRMDFKGKLVHDTSKSDGQQQRTVSNKKLMSLLPDFTFTPIEEGLEASCSWFTENYADARRGEKRRKID